jgi:hypothetical protein
MAPRCVRACLGCRPVFRSLAASLLFHLLLRCFFDLLPFCLWFAVLCVGRLDPEAQTLGGGVVQYYNGQQPQLPQQPWQQCLDVVGGDK